MSQLIDALVAKYIKAPDEMSEKEKQELSFYLKKYVQEMEAEYGYFTAKNLISNMLMGGGLSEVRT